MNPIAEDILMHYGMPRRSGRYPWGSGKNGNKSSASSKKQNKEEKKKQTEAVKKEVDRRKKELKNLRTMSSDEINKKIERLQLEKKYKDLVNDDVAPGKKMVSEILSSSGEKVVKAAVVGTMAYELHKVIKRKFGEDAANYIAPNPNKKQK